MDILFATSEALPFIASGGLADVAGSLPAAIKETGAECRVIMPLYGDIKEELREKMTFVTNFTVGLAWRNQYCGLFTAVENGVTYYFIDNEYYFKRSGIYGFFDDGERFVFFSKAILETLTHIDYAPEIIHCNDWQTAMVPVFLNIFYRNVEKLRSVKTIFTIHNIAYQGKYGMSLATDIAGMPLHTLSKVEYDGCMNMMKGAIEESDLISTVSPGYAQEILDSWYAYGLDKILWDKQYKLSGILNGIDTTLYNPAKDKIITSTYSAARPKNKYVNKAELQEMLGLEVDEKKPLIVIVSRLVGMKGLDLVKYIFDSIIANDVQFAILGTGDSAYENYFEKVSAENPTQVAFYKGYNPELARKMYAGADILLMPSKSEPCGLAQMIAMRYGTLPIVRETGGLKDSVTDMDSEEGGNGFIFNTYNAHDMLFAIERALTLYKKPRAWRAAVVSAMKTDFSWTASAQKYIDLYKSAK